MSVGFGRCCESRRALALLLPGRVHGERGSTMGNVRSATDLIGYDADEAARVTTRDAYGIFHDVDDGSFVTVNRRRAAVVVAVSDGSRNPGNGVVNLSGLDAAKLSGALTAAAVDALTWEEQNR